MREIKFRAWDKNRKIIVDVESLSENEIGYKFNTRKGNTTTIHYKRKRRGYFNLMQYTGLKDKNGEEIYEGDIVSNREQERQSSDVGIVRYDTKSGCLVINNNNGRTKRLTVKVIKNNRVKVLGNIYENPELVEVEG